MTKDRENEMLKASQLYPKHQQKVFVDGVLWGDAHPDLYSATRKAVERERKYLLRKVCAWLQRSTTLAGTTIERLKKAMGEEQ